MAERRAKEPDEPSLGDREDRKVVDGASAGRNGTRLVAAVSAIVKDETPGPAPVVAPAVSRPW